MKALGALAVLASLALAGCVNQAQPVEPTIGDPLDPTGTGNSTLPGGNNTTLLRKPPVARMQVFGADNALVYESNFVADNVTAPTPVRGGATITFLGSLSEAVDKTATLDRFEWSFGDGGTATGRGVTHGFTDLGGVFDITLRVVDSHGLSDVQVLTLGVSASRVVNESLALSGSSLLGTVGTLQDPAMDVSENPLEIKDNVDGSPVRFAGLTLNLTTTDALSDFDLYLLDAEGEVVAQSANGPAPGSGEVLELGPGDLAPGVYTVRVVMFLGVNGAYDIAGEVLYQLVNQQVEERFSGGH